MVAFGMVPMLCLCASPIAAFRWTFFKMERLESCVEHRVPCHRKLHGYLQFLPKHTKTSDSKLIREVP